MEIEHAPASYDDEPAEEDQILKEIREDLGNRVQSVSFLEEEVGTNDEKGIPTWCGDCNDMTGHLFLHGKRWAAQRCLRCGRKTFLRVISQRDPNTRTSLLLHNGFTEEDVLRFACAVFGVDFVCRVMERMLLLRAKEIERDWLRKRSEARTQERAKLREMGTL